MGEAAKLERGEALDEAEARARSLLGRLGRGRVALVFHGDADGIASAALAAAAVERLGGKPFGLGPGKGESVHAPGLAARLAALAPDLVLVFDTGSRAGRPFGSLRAPVVVVDHHRVEGEPDVEVFVSTRGEEALTSTSALALRLLAPLAPLEDRSWLAALGLLGDLGDRARALPAVKEAAASQGITHLREVVALVNAAGRSARHEIESAFEALVRAPGARAVAKGEGKAAELAKLRAEVSASLTRARRVAPRLAGRFAIIEIDEPCRVHGPVAQSWSKRLAPRIVLVANRGYVPGRVHFAVRSDAEIDLRAELRALLPDGGPDFAAGHDRATGGIVAPGTFDRLVSAIESAVEGASDAGAAPPGPGAGLRRSSPAPRSG